MKKYKNDIFFLEKNYNFLLKLLVKNLNIVHKKKYKKKFWEILISRWLFTWVNHVYFRWVYLKKITDKFEIKKYICNQIHPSYAIPVNTHEGHNLCRVDNKWSELIFNQILNYKFENKVNRKFLKKINFKKINFKY